jgi:flavin reductase (DIM6/NTAB) family NADH-FMN oxidoreductase RutF
VRQTIGLGSHDLFIGEIVAVQVDAGVLDTSGRIDMEKANPLVYADARYYGLGRLIDNHGFSFRK